LARLRGRLLARLVRWFLDKLEICLLARLERWSLALLGGRPLATVGRGLLSRLER
jgi:hypothetical protein